MHRKADRLHKRIGETSHSEPRKETAVRKRNHDFLVVGVGASAGDFDALCELLRHIAENTGLAFVLVQHLDPAHESHLADLQNKGLEMAEGFLQLIPRKKVDGYFLPIDHFFGSLARDQAILPSVLSFREQATMENGAPCD